MAFRLNVRTGGWMNQLEDIVVSNRRHAGTIASPRTVQRKISILARATSAPHSKISLDSRIRQGKGTKTNAASMKIKTDARTCDNRKPQNSKRKASNKERKKKQQPRDLVLSTVIPTWTDFGLKMAGFLIRFVVIVKSGQSGVTTLIPVQMQGRDWFKLVVLRRARHRGTDRKSVV